MINNSKGKEKKRSTRHVTVLQNCCGECATADTASEGKFADTNPAKAENASAAISSAGSVAESGGCGGATDTALGA